MHTLQNCFLFNFNLKKMENETYRRKSIQVHTFQNCFLFGWTFLLCFYHSAWIWRHLAFKDEFQDQSLLHEFYLQLVLQIEFLNWLTMAELESSSDQSLNKSTLVFTLKHHQVLKSFHPGTFHPRTQNSQSLID